MIDIINVYPNPSSGIFHLAIPLNVESVAIELYNSNAQFISENTYSVVSGKIKLDLTNNPDGVYLIKVLTEKLMLLKIIKQ